MRLSMAASRQDASLERAALTKTRVSQAVSSGDMGANVRNAIKRRDEMAALIDETDEYYQKHTPYTLVYDPVLKQGKIDYKERTFTVGYTVAVIMSPNVAADYLMIKHALEANPEWKDWELNPKWVFPYGCVAFNASICNAKGDVVGTIEGSKRGEEDIKTTEYTIDKVFGGDTFFVSISADEDTEGIYLRIDNATAWYSTEKRWAGIAFANIRDYTPGYRTKFGGPTPFYTVQDYCTQVWQSYVDSGAALPPGIGMFEKCFGSSVGFHRPVAKAAAIATGGTKKDNVDDTEMTNNDDPAKYYKCINGHGLALISGFAKGIKGRESIVIPKMLNNEIVFAFVGKGIKGNTTLKSVTIADVGDDKNYCLIDNKAFAGCTSLVTVTIHKDAKLLFGKDVFKGCTSLSAESKAAITAAGYKGKF